MRPPGATASLATVASNTPAASPRQPACATATARPSRAANSTGMQSATCMTHTLPARRAMAASAVGGAAGACPDSTSRSATWVPCTCSSHSGSAGKRSCVRTRRRFSATAAPASPTCAPTFSESKGAALTPPMRRVNAARTAGGAGQSGTMTSRGAPPSGALTSPPPRAPRAGAAGPRAPALPMRARARSRDA